MMTKIFLIIQMVEIIFLVHCTTYMLGQGLFEKSLGPTTQSMDVEEHREL